MKARRAARLLLPFLALLRPRQWYKNLLVFVPLVFSGEAGQASLWVLAGSAFLAFCMLSGATYAANDVLDRERDRAHPRKAGRPVASGAVPAKAAVVLVLVVAAAGLIILWGLGTRTLLAGALYLLLQVFYNGWLKHVVLWDVLIVAGGFVARALAGTTAIDVGAPTEWLIMCTFLFAFYLALAKRRHELVAAGDDVARLHRPILAAYTVPFLEQTMQVATALLLAAYSLYTFFGTTNWMMFTIPFAFYGVFRYNYLVHRADIGDEAEMIFRDRATLTNAAVWVALAMLIQAGLLQDGVAYLERL